MTHISRTDLQRRLEEIDGDSARLLESESMSVGLKRYGERSAERKGAREHTEDELYYVLSGTGTIAVGDETHSIAEGDLVSVEEGTSHDVVAVDEEITVLKVFAADY